jgi:predicted lipoprotein with Yx(FWY)xxD motif
MTLYQSTKDAIGVSNCTGACATAWPPYTVSAAAAATLTADPGVAGKIGTMKRADGSLQVTYRGLPLYFFTQDTKPGDTTGEAINGFTEVAP